MNNRSITTLFIKTKVIFLFILLKENYTEIAFENPKFTKILVKIELSNMK